MKQRTTKPIKREAYSLTLREKKTIEKAAKKTVKEYKKTLDLLAKT